MATSQAVLAQAPPAAYHAGCASGSSLRKPVSTNLAAPFKGSVAGLRWESQGSVQAKPSSSSRVGVDIGIVKEATARRAVVTATAVEPKNILMMGGTRFIGLFLARELVKAGHQVTLFTRGKAPICQQLPGESDEEFADYSSKVKHLQGDRQDFDGLKEKLKGTNYNIVYDINGREGKEVDPILESLPGLEQYIFCSSAGVYLKSDQLPHFEVDAVDPKSRHKGKLNTETLLQSRGTPWTSIRPVYIYGPLNYNPVEEWFFQRLKEGRPIPVPNSGLQITQLGHVKDLAEAFVKVLKNEQAYGQIYNISGAKYVTFDGIAKACAKVEFKSPTLRCRYHYCTLDIAKVA
jgi:nucleoside-diphosphate-sugar epimerase